MENRIYRTGLKALLDDSSSEISDIPRTSAPLVQGSHLTYENADGELIKRTLRISKFSREYD
ncbi:Uncharacterised protein [uncultured archaeon]|nr:Uncharacterised protein [uncultured archaeon]